jgi:hypothetical protein
MLASHPIFGGRRRASPAAHERWMSFIAGKSLRRRQVAIIFVRPRALFRQFQNIVKSYPLPVRMIGARDATRTRDYIRETVREAQSRRQPGAKGQRAESRRRHADLPSRSDRRPTDSRNARLRPEDPAGSRLAEEKGIETIIEAFIRSTAANLLVVGGGPWRRIESLECQYHGRVKLAMCIMTTSLAREPWICSVRRAGRGRTGKSNSAGC